MENEVPAATWRDRVMFFAGRRQAFLVDGDSMLPTLKSGDAVLVDGKAKVKIGDLVLAEHPYRSSVKIVKRVAETSANGYVLSGDNPAESTDSRTFGAVSIESIIGRVVCKLK
jgi:nickel-type superoxide dismutase maturation protease